MGCASSKSVDVVSTVADVYRPPPTSMAVFDISTVEDPWLITTTVDQEKQADQEASDSRIHPHPRKALDCLPSALLAEIIKALENLKPSLDQKSAPPPRRKPTSLFINTAASHVDDLTPPPPELSGRRPVKEDSFLIRDRLEREGFKGADAAKKIEWKGIRRVLPLTGVVLYTQLVFAGCEGRSRIAYPNALEVDEHDVTCRFTGSSSRR